MRTIAAAVFLGLLASAAAALAGELIGSKHDLTSLNRRAGVEAMTGLAFNNYRDPCVYCHLPDSVEGSATALQSGNTGWNRYLAEGEYELYDSPTLGSPPEALGTESLLCLSCHDGTMAVDMVINKPSDWQMSDEAPMHMRLDKGGGLDRCSQCHDGVTAHKIEQAVIGRSLMDDHPVGMDYPGLSSNPDYFKPGAGQVFSNGVRLFAGKVECATCHNVHDPDISPFLRVETTRLCLTCHNK